MFAPTSAVLQAGLLASVKENAHMLQPEVQRADWVGSS